MSSPTDRPPARQRRRTRATRARILDAALRELGRNPDSSLGDIAEAAGVARRTLYTHFAGRAALVRGLTEDAVRAIGHAMADLSALDAGAGSGPGVGSGPCSDPDLGAGSGPVLGPTSGSGSTPCSGPTSGSGSTPCSGFGTGSGSTLGSGFGTGSAPTSGLGFGADSGPTSASDATPSSGSTPGPDHDPASALARFVLTLWPVGDAYRTLIGLAPQDLGPDRLRELLAPARETVAGILAEGQSRGVFHAVVPPGPLSVAIEAHLLALLGTVNAGIWADDGSGAATSALIAAGVDSATATATVRRLRAPGRFPMARHH
ncbi:TetR family transcriptional regulator [Streptomyces sp. bgisy027]|uniref:TetR/AcrR family transcriptional regulator n=1 Tax=Streptomyces sp. bgisy027 TaxID=3413770 RepID=UPI003D730A91